MSFDYYSIIKHLSNDYNNYNKILDNKKPIDISEEKFQQLLNLLQCEEFYSKSNNISYKEFFNSKDLLIEYHRIFDTLHPVNYKDLIIYFKVKCKFDHLIDEFSKENVDNYTIEDIEMFYQFTTIENLRDSIYLIDSLIQLMNNINRIFIQDGRDRRSFIRCSNTFYEIGIYQYIREKTLTFLHLCIDCLEFIKKNHEIGDRLSDYISFRYNLQFSFIKISLPFEIQINNKEEIICQIVHNIDEFLYILSYLPVTERYKEIFKDFIDEDYSRYDKKWKTTKSSRNVTEQEQ